MSDRFLFFILILILLVSCRKQDSVDFEPPLAFVTKASGGELEEFFVTEKDIEDYISFKSMEGLSRNEHRVKKSVSPISWNNDVCLYAIQYEKGFEILSADKRSPIPLIDDIDGVFEYPSESSPLGFHIFTLAEEVWLSLHNSDYLDEPDEEVCAKMESSLLFWKLVNSDVDTINSLSVKTKSVEDTLTDGHWERISMSSHDIVYDTVGHLVPTWWHQDAPFNQYSPRYSPINSTRCPAGCVAIAAAQVLYFLHYRFGVPANSPTTVISWGYALYHSFVSIYDNYSSETWDNMSPNSDPYGYAALLIGRVGQQVHMDYGLTGSSAHTSDLPELVFGPNGINSSRMDHYSGAFLSDELEDGFPVICAGQRADTSSTGNITYPGHSFIVDRYIRYQREMTVTYQWVYDNPEAHPGSTITKTTVYYGTPFISLYQMNWGYGYYSNQNNTWCSMSGVWQYHSRKYVYDRQMIYGFRVMNE